MKKSIRNCLPDTVYNYIAHWTGNDVTTNHIAQLCNDVYSCLSQNIQKQLDLSKGADPLEEEKRSHNYFGKERTKIFIGRQKILNDISKYVSIGNRSTTNKVEPLTIYGKSGSGKSSLIATAIVQSRKEYAEVYVMSRFIGVTSSSSNIQTLIEGMCRDF